MSNPVKEYLVSIGLDLNRSKLNQTQQGIKQTTSLLDKMRQTSDFLRRGLNGVALSMLAVAGASAKLVTSLAKQDQGFETLAQRMAVSRKSVREFQYAVKSLGVSIDEIQFNPTLMRQYRELISDSRRLDVGSGYEKAMGTVRSFLFEFVRLKQESMYLLQWIGFSIVKNLEVPLEKARQTIREINDYIVKNMPRIGDVVGKMIFNVKNFSASLIGFFSNIVKEVASFWASLPGWAKKFVLGTGLIGAIFIGMQNPLIFVSTLLAGIALLIDDFQKHVQGKKAQFGEFWDNLIKWVKRTRETIYEWKDKSLKWIESFVSLCKSKIPELKTLWDNVSKWITENGSKSVDSLMKLISATDDFFSRMSFYWGQHKANPAEFWWKLSTGEMESMYDAYRLNKMRENREEPGQVQTLGNVPTSGGTVSGGQWDAMINEYAGKYGISAGLLKAVMMQESGGNPSAVSAAGAQGLMQLMPETAKGLGVTDPLDPRQSIEGGAKYLSQLKKRYNSDVPSILRAYNWGMGNVDDLNAGRIPASAIPAETNAYVKAVTEAMRKQAAPTGARVTPIVQARDNTCGVVAVAMANNAINGNNDLTEDYVLTNYNFRLLDALNATNRNKNLRWKDLGNKGAITDKEIAEMAKASAAGLPFIFAANNGQFSPSGRGHFMTGKSVDVKNQKITYVDPATGTVETATFDDLKHAGLHPQGNAVFVPYQVNKPKAKATPAAAARKTPSGRLTSVDSKVEEEGWWRYRWGKFQEHLNEINPFADKNAKAGYYNAQNSNVYVGGINMTINTNSSDPRAVGNAVADSLQNRMNYFALNRGLNLS